MRRLREERRPSPGGRTPPSRPSLGSRTPLARPGPGGRTPLSRPGPGGRTPLSRLGGQNTAVPAPLSHPGFTKCPPVPRGSMGSTLASFSLCQCSAQHILLVNSGFDHVPSAALVHCLYPWRADLLLLQQFPFSPHPNAAGQSLSCSAELHRAPLDGRAEPKADCGRAEGSAWGQTPRRDRNHA